MTTGPPTIVFDRSFDTTPGAPERLSPLVRRLLCDNPGPFTFRGTSTFIVGNGEVAVIDPGPDNEAHLAAILDAVRGETVSHILVTHSHADHSPLAVPLARATGARTYGFQRHAAAPAAGGLDASVDVSFKADVELRHGDTLEAPGFRLEALHTPGHMSDHLCLALAEESALFTGDHVMAWSTSIVAPPHGNMGHYMASLDLLRARRESHYLPAHGPSLRDPLPYVEALIAHRHWRERAILAALKAGRRLPEIVSAVYAGLDPALHAAAGLTARAHLEHLIEQGLVEQRDDAFYANGR